MASAAYRAGEKLHSEYYGEDSDYTNKGGVICSEILLPPHAPREYKELPAFMKPENYLKNAEMQMEDDYGMIDGVINNGSKEAEKPVAKPEETKLKKPSVLAKLRQYQAEDRKEKTMQQYAERDL